MAEISYVGSAALIARLMDQVVPAVRESLEDLVAESQSRTPVDTGTLRAGQTVVDFRVTVTEVSGRVATGGESNEYALYVHQGTYKMAARPFMAQALLANADVYRQAIQAAAAGAF
jgi:HK97 gp10 family phage protein